MEILLFKNRISILFFDDFVSLNIVVPRRNVQNMLDVTEAILINKSIINLKFNHNAGICFDVCIKVRFSKIKPFLKKSSIMNASNYIDFSSFCHFSGNYQLGFIDEVPLYAFGSIPFSDHIKASKVSYYNKFGIEKKYAQLSEMPRYKYSTKHGWCSNRAF